MEIINLTPHPIIIISDKGVTQDKKTKVFLANRLEIEILIEFPVDGILPRVEFAQVEKFEIADIPFVRVKEKNKIIDLPEKTDNTILIVSGIVAANAKRNDLVAPNELVRDVSDKGIILGCLSLRFT